MKKIILVSVVLICVFNLYGQIGGNVKSDQELQVADSATNNKPIYSFSSGLSVFAGKHIPTTTSFFFSPEVSYNFSTKLFINAGLIINQNYYSYPSQNLINNSGTRNTTVTSQNIFYASGDYLLTPNLMISGSMLKSFPGSSENMSGNGLFQNDLNYINLGISYKVSNKLTISGGFSLTQYSNN